jgi:hypothetical protein
VLARKASTSVATSCERLVLGAGGWQATVRLSARSVRASVRCLRPCSGTLVVSAGGVTLARARLVHRRSGRLVARLQRGTRATARLRARFAGAVDSLPLLL